MLKSLLALLLSLFLQEKVTDLSFSTPAGTDAKTAEKCASQMKRRIADYGYKGVEVTSTAEGVKVTFAPGFTPIMALTIERLALTKGQAFLWATLPMTEQEFEQWIPGKTSPPGTSWLIDDENKTIMDNSWKTPIDARFERYLADGGVERTRLAFTKADSKKFLERHAKERVGRHFLIVLDGKRFPYSGMFTERTVFDKVKNDMVSLGLLDWIPAAQLTDEGLARMVCIGSPFPVELSKAK